MIKWHLESRKISSLKPHPKNPRYLKENDAYHLKVSLEKFGLIDKPIINPDGLIIGGHQRINVLKGSKKNALIDCWVPDRPLEEKEVEELNIRLNRNTGDWDWEVLANQWEVSDLCEWGFSVEEILGNPLVPEEVKEEISPKEEKEKKKSECPSCGHIY